MHKYKLIIGGILLTSLFIVSQGNPALAVIGVGVGTGKIQIDEKLHSGIIYELPILSVVNTGDEESDYEVGVAYHQDQKQYLPAESWFLFNPKTFHLKPGQAQNVEIKLNLPLKTIPGDYFAYLEGRPTKVSSNGSTNIGVAAAAKLYFTITPSNVLQGFYYRTLSLWDQNQPWSGRLLVLFVGIVTVLVLKRFLNIQVNVKKQPRKNEESSISTSQSIEKKDEPGNL